MAGLDLKKYMLSLMERLNEEEVQGMGFIAVNHGLTFDAKKRHADVYEYSKGKEIIVCPEPLSFLKEFDDISNDKGKANERFKEKIASFQRIKLDYCPTLQEENGEKGPVIWMNKTLNGINLRPGILQGEADERKYKPIVMCDDNVHGLIAGRTGSGKSVYINALVLNLITEYAPWELDLYLADFKKVELSRYMNDADEANHRIAYTPHLRACAATSEIRYVSSLIQYLVNCMNARNEFFMRLGVTKIKEFRENYGIVLPRVLLVVDEFQQLFTEATAREAEEIQTMLNSITKLGRATGFHLVFASQEMSGTLRGNTLANFKIRMCLPCNQQISADILGNGAAADLDRGFVLINTGEDNLKYQVPFINTDQKDTDTEKSAFCKYLDRIKLESRHFDLSYKYDSQKFYQEDLQEQEPDYIEDLNRIQDSKNRMIAQRNDLFDGIVMGKTVLYSVKKNDKVAFYIERGRNKGIMIASPNADDVAKIRKLLTENLIRSGTDTLHIGMELNNLVLERFRPDEKIRAVPGQSYEVLDTEEGLQYLRILYYLRKQIWAYTKDRNQQEKLQSIAVQEQNLVQMYQRNDLVEFNQQKQKKLVQLKEQISRLTEKQAEIIKESSGKLRNPVIEFIKNCNKTIILFKDKNLTAELERLGLYQEILDSYLATTDVDSVTKQHIEHLDKEIADIKTKKDDSSIIIFMRLSLIQIILKYFRARYLNEEVVVPKGFLPKLEEQYQLQCENIDTFRSSLLKKQQANKERENVEKELRKLKEELKDLQNQKDPIEEEERSLETTINDIMSACYKKTYDLMGYRKDRPETPHILISYKDGSIMYLEDQKAEDQNLFTKLLSDISIDMIRVLQKYSQKGEIVVSDFRKCIFWINGLDEIEKVPNYLMEIIRDAINCNILMVITITSELRDPMIKKAFDYAFITGNVEKFYNMFDIKYTKQPMDSIVVNFGIRSKGMSIPFKMYKSTLGNVQSPQFIEELLEGI